MAHAGTQKSIQRICAFILLLGSFLLSIQAACPDPSVTEGYLGNLGVTSGNCEMQPLPPLDAFGSLTINQNGPLASVNRLNPTQLPTTNNFQIFQNPCAIDPTTWTFDPLVDPNHNLDTGGGVLKNRCGPFLVGMSRVGPTATIPQFNFNVDGGRTSGTNSTAGFPNLLADARYTFFFSAVEATTSFFNISTNVVNAQTCLVTYTPTSGGGGQLVDYNVIGNIFHDVYYANLTPNLAIGNALLTMGTSAYVVVDPFLTALPGDGPTPGLVALVPSGSTITGRSFLFFVQRYAPLGPAVFLLYAVNSADTSITLTLTASTGNNFFITASGPSAPYTGFLRLAALSTNDPNPTVGMPWTQASFFMPEDSGNGADNSLDPPMTCTGNFISNCAIEDPTCCLTPCTDAWWKTVEVDAIAPTGMNFYMLFPSALSPTPWTSAFTSLAKKVIGNTWSPGALKPDVPGLSDILPIISLSDSTTADNWYTNWFLTQNPSDMAPYTDSADVATNFFLLQFDMFMAQNLAIDIANFQSGNRLLPTYTVTAPNNIMVYNDHRRYVPVQADITTTANSIQWNYTLSTDVSPGDGMNKTLVCFPLWKYLQGAPQNFIYNDTIKGTLYAAEADNGAVTFLEGNIPDWYVPTSTNLFIPTGLTFSGPQLNSLGTALTQIEHQIVPLPYFPENQLDAAYNAGKTCYMLAKSGLYIAYYLTQAGMSSQIVTITKPYIDNAKSCLTAYLLGRTPGSSFFIGDRTAGGVCVNGAGGDGTYAKGPNLQQDVDSGVDFGNYVYNDHHFFAGYFLVAAAMVTNWEMLYGSQPFWINLQVVGGDGQSYFIRNMIDFLWRDVHNPFTSDSTQTIYDPDLPYNRSGFPWEGHSVANGLQYQPNALGRNQESISEDFNCWLGINTYAYLVLQNGILTPTEITMYQTLRDFSLMNLKMTASAGIQWYKNTQYWKGTNMYITNPTSTSAAMYIGQFTQATVTNGQVNDNSAQNQTFF